jgi:flavin-dependent dehydrogenase
MYDVICIGGGLAGLTAAIHLRKEGHKVLVLEKEKYPHHKVCGEYLSREVLPYLSELGVTLPTDIEINTLEFSSRSGRSLELDLPLGAVGISRFTLDHTLYRTAVSEGVHFEYCTATSVDFDGFVFTVKAGSDKKFTSPFALGTYGKRSSIDKYLDRGFINRKSPWLAVKAHYDWPRFPENRVGLHSFEGGYAGISKTESRAVNFCYLASYKTFGRFRDIDDFNTSIVAQNPHLNQFLNEARLLFERPLTIAQISFENKNPVESHMLMCGDTAGLIHPLCGNGMAMAIHSAKIAAELLDKELKQGKVDRIRLERDYAQTWKKTFGSRIRTGQYLQRILLSNRMTDLLFSLVVRSPGMLKRIISKTHGNPTSL